LLYEANPLAFIVEAAGGSATDGKADILNIMPDELHQRTPLYIGSKEDVQTARDLLKEEGDGQRVERRKNPQA
jgi:fructose-1,6-bisphosphatase I